MGSPSREPAHVALFAQAQTLSWTDPYTGLAATPAFTARRVFDWSSVKAYPAICQAEPMETSKQVTGLPQKRSWSVKWLIYFKIQDEDLSPGSTSNAILDAIDALFPTWDTDDQPYGFNPFLQQQQMTLGGTVNKCSVDGQIRKFNGDLSGQALLVVPFTLLAP